MKWGSECKRDRAILLYLYLSPRPTQTSIACNLIIYDRYFRITNFCICFGLQNRSKDISHKDIYIYIFESQTYISRKIILQYIHYSSFPLFFILRYELIVGHFSSGIIAEYYRSTLVIQRKSILFRNISNNIPRI